MKLLAYFRSLGARFLRRHQIENEMEEELWSHIQLRAEHLQQSGMNRAEAERQARIQFGCPERFKEECRETLAGNFLDTLIQDARFSLRMLRNLRVYARCGFHNGPGDRNNDGESLLWLMLHCCVLCLDRHPGELVQIVDDLPGVGVNDVGISILEME